MERQGSAEPVDSVHAPADGVFARPSARGGRLANDHHRRRPLDFFGAKRPSVAQGNSKRVEVFFRNQAGRATDASSPTNFEVGEAMPEIRNSIGPSYSRDLRQGRDP